LGCDRKVLLTLRHRPHERARIGLDLNPLDDVVEADEMYRNAGEKGVPHDDLDDPTSGPARSAGPSRARRSSVVAWPPVLT
jgi:hypothetical protein